MANLAASAVTRLDTWWDGTSRRRKIVEATLVLTGQGGTTNKILASLFGMSKVQSVACRGNDNTLVLAWPSYDGTFICLFQTQADGTAFAPIDVTGITLKMTVTGIE